MSKRKRTLSAPAPQLRRARALDAFTNVLARLGAGTPNLLEGTEYSLQRLSRDFNQLNALYRESWIIRRIIDVIPSDMLKNWITITSGIDPDVEKKLSISLRRTQLIDKLKRGMQWGRLYGGALGVMLVKHQGYNLSQPLRLDWIMPGDFAGLLIFDRWNGVNPSNELIEDISDPDYGYPKYYTVTDPAGGGSVKIHHSRVIRFTGNTLPFWEEIAEMQWGASVVESVFDELKKRDNVSWNIAQLTFMANIRVLKMQDLGQLLAATDSESQAELLRTLEAQNMLLNNMGMQVMDAADGLETHQYTFGGLADCYQQFIMDISGAAEIPVTKLFGRSPSGLNATGESDLQNYYDMIAEKQEAVLRPILNKVLPPFIISTIGSLPEDFDFDFDPVAEPTDKERADLAKCGTDNVVAAYNAGLISQRTALQELKQQSERTGVWTNITDEDIERASDTVEQAGEMGGTFGGMENMDMSGEQAPQCSGNAPQVSLPAMDKKPWKESEHNRGQPGNAGQFTKTGGDGSSNSKENKSDNGLQKSATNAKMNAENDSPPAPPDKKAYYRKELVGYEAMGLGKIKAVSDHACNRIYNRRISVDVIKKALSDGEKYPDTNHGGYIYECAGIKVSLTKNCVIKTIWTKETNGLQYGMEDKLERWKAKYGGTS
nr:MAG TPA: Portal [Caudoviricetes sp.]